MHSFSCILLYLLSYNFFECTYHINIYSCIDFHINFTFILYLFLYLFLYFYLHLYLLLFIFLFLYFYLARYQESCCSANANIDGSGDFSSLGITPNTSCNSVTAPFITNALCSSQNSCQFNISKSETYVFPLDSVTNLLSLSKTSLSSNKLEVTDICQSIYESDGIDYCSTTFEYNGNFENCGGNFGIGAHGVMYDSYGNPKNNLIFEAVCIPNLIRLGQNDENVKITFLPPNKIVHIVSILDSISILIFILGVAWLKHEIEKEKKETGRDQCTASDYTVICYTLPKSVKDEKSVKNILKNHLECVLNNNKKIITNEIHGSPQDRANDIKEEIKIVDINCSTYCGDYLSAAEGRGSAAVVVDRLIAKIRSTLKTTKFHLRHSIARIRNIKIRSKDGMIEKKLEPYDLEKNVMINNLKIALYKFEYFNDLCLLLHESAQNSVHSAYITFESEYSYADCLRQIPNQGIFTRLIQDRKYNLEGQTVFIKVRTALIIFAFLHFCIFAFLHFLSFFLSFMIFTFYKFYFSFFFFFLSFLFFYVFSSFCIVLYSLFFLFLF